MTKITLFLILISTLWNLYRFIKYLKIDNLENEVNNLQEDSLLDYVKIEECLLNKNL